MRDDPVVVALVARARDGDRAAWDEIVRRYTPLLCAVCHHFQLHGSDLDDVAASVWLRLVERLGTLREPAALPGWLATTTRRECMQVVRARSRLVDVDQDAFPDPDAPEPGDWLLVEEQHIALRDALPARMPERCRELLTLVTADPPVPYVEIAERMSIAVGGIGPTRQRCLDKLRRQPSIAAMMDTARTGRR